MGIVALAFFSFSVGIGLSAAPDGGTTTWNGDFETGNTTQYSYGDSAPGGMGGYQCKTQDGSRGKVVSKADGYPVRAGAYSSRQHVEVGDTNVAGSNSGERCDVFKGGSDLNVNEGADMWYSVSIYLPSDYNPAPSTNWNDLYAFHTSGGGWPGTTLQLTYLNRAPNAPNESYPDLPQPGKVALGLFGGPNFNEINSESYNVFSPERNKWYDFIFHVKWSSQGSEGGYFYKNPPADPGQTGFIEMYINGQEYNPAGWSNGPVAGRHYRPTLFSGLGGYTKLTNYRDGGASQASTIYFDEAKAGTSRCAVQVGGCVGDSTPPPPVTTTAPAPAPAPTTSAPAPPTPTKTTVSLPSGAGSSSGSTAPAVKSATASSNAPAGGGVSSSESATPTPAPAASSGGGGAGAAPTSLSPTRTVKWGATRFASARVMQQSLAHNGISWEAFLDQHAAIARAFNLRSVNYGPGFFTKNALASWLSAHQMSIAGWKSTHPAATALLETQPLDTRINANLSLKVRRDPRSTRTLQVHAHMYPGASGRLIFRDVNGRTVQDVRIVADAAGNMDSRLSMPAQGQSVVRATVIAQYPAGKRRMGAQVRGT